MAISQGPVRGSFTTSATAGTPQRIAVPSGVDYIKWINTSRYGTAINSATANLRYVRGEYYANMAAGSCLIDRQDQSATETTLEAAQITSNGITLIDDGDPASFAAVATANPAFNQADGATFTTGSAHGLAVGDVVRVYGLTGALQYAGLLLSVVTVPSTTTFTCRLNTTGITQATAGFVKKIASGRLFYPQNRQIAAITVGTTTVIRLTVQHYYEVGDKVSFRIPDAYGMVELDGLVGEVTAVNAALATNTITVDIDSSAFTAFAFPTSANFQTSFAQVIPVGEIASKVTNPSENDGIIGVEFGSDICSGASEVINFWCFYGGQVLS